MTTGVLLIIYANKSHVGLTNLENTLKKTDFKYEIIGMGEIWHGFKTKMSSLKKRLANLDSKQLVCILDAFDVLVIGTEQELLKKFKKFETPLIAGVERIRAWFPRPQKYYEYHDLNPKKLQYPFINAGCIIGTAGEAHKFYNWALQRNNTDDQTALVTYANTFPERVSLDSNRHIVANVDVFENSLEEKNGRFYDPVTKTYPIFIHTPACAWDLYKRMDRYGEYLLGAQYIKISFTEKVKTILKKLEYRCLELIRNYKSLLLFLLLLVIIIVFLLILVIKK